MRKRWIFGYLLLGSALFVGAPALASLLSSADDDSAVTTTRIARAEEGDTLHFYKTSGSAGVLPSFVLLELPLFFALVLPAFAPALRSVIKLALNARAPPAAA